MSARRPEPLHLVRPAWVDDPARPSGGNVYDRRVADALGAVEHATTGTVHDGATVLVDGLLASAALREEVGRLRVFVLVHLPRVEPWEGPLLRAVDGVVATSRWTRDWLVGAYGLAPERVHVAPPGVDPAPIAPGTPAGAALLCVGAVSALKGHDVLAAALRTLRDLTWSCRAVGPVRERALADEVGDVLALEGPVTGRALEAAYAGADLLVLPSRTETYGMVAAEALARGLPVVASDVGGVREALDGAGVLLPADDPAALADALRRWLTDPGHRRAQRTAALRRRATLTGWDETAGQVAAAVARAEVPA